MKALVCDGTWKSSTMYSIHTLIMLQSRPRNHQSNRFTIACLLNRCFNVVTSVSSSLVNIVSIHAFSQPDRIYNVPEIDCHFYIMSS